MPSPATLVSVDAVKRQLRIEHDEEDIVLGELLNDAEDIIATFMGDRFDADWDEATVPGAVRAAILRQCAFMWKHRGDDPVPGVDDSGLAPHVRFLLQANGYRDLTIA